MSNDMRGARRARRPPVHDFVDALLKADSGRAYALAQQTASTGPSLAVFADLVQPALYEVGELWYSGAIGVADEHRATAIAQRVIEALAPAGNREERTGVRPAITLAAVDSEQHVLGLQIVATALEADGWDVDLLIPGLPFGDLLAAVAAKRPRVVGLSAGYLPSERALADAIARIKGAGRRVLVGGAAFNRQPDLWRRVGADGHAPDCRVATVLARRLAR